MSKRCPICKHEMRTVNARYGLFSYCLRDKCMGKRDNFGRVIQSHTWIDKTYYARQMKRKEDYGKFDD